MASVKFTQLFPSPDANSKSVPLPRSSHGISALEPSASGGAPRLVLYGGENIARTPIEEPGQVLWLAEKSDGGGGWSWTSPAAGESAPPARVAHSQAAVGDAVYIFGGRNGIGMGECAMNDMWKLEVASSEGACIARWTEVAPAGGSPVPEERSFHKMISIGTDLYMFGGCGSGGRLNDLWKYDTVSRKWTDLGKSNTLRGRGGPNVLTLKGTSEADVRIAIVAGFAGEETNDGHVFSNGSWEATGMEGLAEMRKRSVCCYGSMPHLNRCLIFGGEVDPSKLEHEGAGNFERDLVVLDGTTGDLVELIRPREGEEWPGARGWADAATAGDDFYIFGGLAGDDATPERLGDLWHCRVSGIWGEEKL